MRKSLRKNSKEVKELFKGNIKCELISQMNDYQPREVSKTLVQFDLELSSSSISRGVENESYCVYAGNDKYNVTVLK